MGNKQLLNKITKKMFSWLIATLHIKVLERPKNANRNFNQRHPFISRKKQATFTSCSRRGKFGLIVFCYKPKKTEKSLEKTILFLLLLLLLSINPSFPECFRVEICRSKAHFSCDMPFDGFSYISLLHTENSHKS